MCSLEGKKGYVHRGVGRRLWRELIPLSQSEVTPALFRDPLSNPQSAASVARAPRSNLQFSLSKYQLALCPQKQCNLSINDLSKIAYWGFQKGIMPVFNRRMNLLNLLQICSFPLVWNGVFRSSNFFFAHNLSFDIFTFCDEKNQFFAHNFVVELSFKNGTFSYLSSSWISYEKPSEIPMVFFYSKYDYQLSFFDYFLQKRWK